MSARLEARLSKLEAREDTAKGLPTVFIMRYDSDDRLTRFRTGDEIVERQPGESVADLERRCEASRPDGRLWIGEYRDEGETA